jgi:hypothetical protein
MINRKLCRHVLRAFDWWWVIISWASSKYSLQSSEYSFYACWLVTF